MAGSYSAAAVIRELPDSCVPAYKLPPVPKQVIIAVVKAATFFLINLVLSQIENTTSKSLS